MLTLTYSFRKQTVGSQSRFPFSDTKKRFTKESDANVNLQFRLIVTIRSPG